MRGPPPPKIAHSDPTSIDPGRPVDWDATIAANRWRFRRCYAKALETNPDAGGTVHATVTIGAEGSVTAATASGSNYAPLDACVAGTLKGIGFKSSGQTAVVNLSVMYATSK